MFRRSIPNCAFFLCITLEWSIVPACIPLLPHATPLWHSRVTVCQSMNTCMHLCWVHTQGWDRDMGHTYTRYYSVYIQEFRLYKLWGRYDHYGQFKRMETWAWQSLCFSILSYMLLRGQKPYLPCVPLLIKVPCMYTAGTQQSCAAWHFGKRWMVYTRVIL